MEISDNTKKLLDLFAKAVETGPPDPEQALATPTQDLEAGKEQATELWKGVVRPKDRVDPTAVGRQRFPELQGTAGLFAEGLAKHADIVDESFGEPDLFTGVIAIDQAIGRFIYVAQLFINGGDTGEALAGAGLQQVCEDTVDQARTRIEDLRQPAPVRSDLSVAFAEPFRVQEDHQQRLQQAQATGKQAAQPYQARIDQARKDTALTNAVDSYMTSVNEGEDKA